LLCRSRDGGDTDDDPPRRACKFVKADAVAKIGGFAYGTTKNNEVTMAANLASMSPFSICVGELRMERGEKRLKSARVLLFRKCAWGV
jgi:hypothetical protein